MDLDKEEYIEENGDEDDFEEDHTDNVKHKHILNSEICTIYNNIFVI